MPREEHKIICAACQEGRHEECDPLVNTGRTVLFRSAYQSRAQMVPEWVPCSCGCETWTGA